MTQHYELEDDFGRVTKFDGDLLVSETTDTEDHRKPQWTDTDVYRTAGGQYVIWSNSQYRIRHLARCRKTAGYDLIPAEDSDTFPCPVCNPDNLPGGYGQLDRVKVEVCKTPEDLINWLSSINNNNGVRTHSQYSQALLAKISDVDDAMHSAWMEQVVS